MSLEERITRLEDIEAVRQLQARYQRCLDTHDWDGVAACFTADAVSAYDNGSLSYNGREAIIGFLSSSLTRAITSTHLIHGGEIDVQPDGSATGIWYLEDFLLHSTFLLKLHGAAVYEVEYRKLDGQWFISKIGYRRCYQYFERRPILNLLTLGKRTFRDAK